MPARRLSALQEQELLFHLEQERLERARGNFRSFISLTKPDYRWVWFNVLFAKKLQDFAEGKIPRLMIFVPPRHGKSEQVSKKLPPYILGRFQARNPRIILCSYSGALSGEANIDCQRLMDSPQYQDLFPKCRINDESGRKFGAFKRSAGQLETFREQVEPSGLVRRLPSGSIRAVGIGGAVTGFGADFIMIDDIHKNQQEADSIVMRERAHKFYKSTLYTRLQKGGAVCLTMTRWHEDDLAGRLLAEAKADPTTDQWEVIRFPALAEPPNHKDRDPRDPRAEGEALWPEEYPVEDVKRRMKSVGTRVAEALFQQRPTAAAGNIIKREWTLHRWTKLPLRFDKIILSWDCAFEGTDDADFVVGQVWGRVGSKLYLIDQVRDRMGFVETVQAIKDQVKKYPLALRKLVERKANGHAVIQVLKSKVSGIIAVEPQGSKESRVRATETLWEAGDVILPDSSQRPWISDYIEELVSFPNGVNDDQVDATSQALNDLVSKGTNVLEQTTRG